MRANLNVHNKSFSDVLLSYRLKLGWFFLLFIGIGGQGRAFVFAADTKTQIGPPFVSIPSEVLDKEKSDGTYRKRIGPMIQLTSGVGVTLRNQLPSSQTYLSTELQVGYAFFDNCAKPDGICFNLSAGGKFGTSLLPSANVYGVQFGFVGEVAMLFNLGKLSRFLGPYVSLTVGAALSNPYGEQFYVPPEFKISSKGVGYIDTGTDMGLVVQPDSLFKSKIPIRFKVGINVSRNPYGDGVSIVPLKIGVEINF